MGIRMHAARKGMHDFVSRKTANEYPRDQHYDRNHRVEDSLGNPAAKS